MLFALPATDAINAAHCSGTKICSPGQLGVRPAVLRVGCACRPIAITDTLRLLTDGNRILTHTDHRPQTPYAGHGLVCFVPRPRPACALLKFTQAPAHILRVSNSADIGIISWT